MEESFAVQYMPYINLVVLIVVGIVLVRIINIKNTLISTTSQKIDESENSQEGNGQISLRGVNTFIF